MPSEKPTAIVYIDGLNLFYRTLSKRNHLKWLNVFLLARNLAPHVEISKVKYFSAAVKRLDGQTDPQIRQQIYLQALRTLEPTVEITLGEMRVDSRVYPVSPRSFDGNGHLKKARVFKYEEKGTDVSIATELTIDASLSSADEFILISSDKDFNPMVDLVTRRFNSKITFIDPKSISEINLLESQFPSSVGSNIQKPRSWLN